MKPSRPSPDVEVAQYGAILRRRWWIVLLGLVAGVVLAGVALSVLPQTFTSTASVLVRPTGDDGAVENGRTSGEVNLDTEAQIVTSTSVALAARETLGTDQDPRTLRRSVAVTVPANTSVLNISFSAPTASKAQQGASAFAQAYLDNRAALAEAQAEVERQSIQARIDGLREDLRAVIEQLAALGPDSADRGFRESQRDLLLDQISGLNADLVGLRGGEVSPGIVLTEAQTPPSPSAPNRLLVLVSGVMVGLLLGLGLALLIDRADRRVRTRHDLERLGLDVLVGTFVVPPPNEIAAGHGQRYDAESLRMLRNALLAQLPGHRGSIMVAPASASTSGSAVALNLAATLARSGLEVILVSAGSHTRGADAGADASRGLAEVLQDAATSDDVLRTVNGEPGLIMMGSGRDASLYSQLVQSEEAKKVLADLAERADILVIDVAPVTENADAQSLASQFDGIVLVATARQTTTTDVVEAVDQFRHVQARLFGAVIVEQSSEKALSPVVTSARRGSAHRAGAQPRGHDRHGEPVAAEDEAPTSDDARGPDPRAESVADSDTSDAASDDEDVDTAGGDGAQEDSGDERAMATVPPDWRDTPPRSDGNGGKAAPNRTTKQLNEGGMPMQRRRGRPGRLP